MASLAAVRPKGSTLYLQKVILCLPAVWSISMYVQCHECPVLYYEFVLCVMYEQGLYGLGHSGTGL